MHPDDSKSLELTIIDSAAMEELRSVALEAIENTADAAFTDGIVAAIPGAALIRATLKIGSSVRDYLFCKGLLRFVYEFSSIPQVERQRQIEKLLNPTEQKRVGENLLLLISRTNDFSKPVMMARVFGAFIREQIDRPTMFALWHAIDAINIGCIPRLEKLYGVNRTMGPYRNITTPDDEDGHLLSCGLLSLAFAEAGGSQVIEEGEEGMWYGRRKGFTGALKTNTLGKHFVKHAVLGDAI